MNDWSQIDMLAAGLLFGFVAGALLGAVGIWAFMAGAKEQFEKRLREDGRRESTFGVPGRCRDCCHLAGQRIGAGGGAKHCGCECHEPNRSPSP